MEPSLGEGAVPVQRLHVTLLMLTLANEDQELVAKHVLKGVQPLIACVLPPTHPLRLQGVSAFRNKIFYVGLEQDPSLTNLVKILKFKFSQAGIALEGNRDVFVPHISVVRAPLAKVSPARAREVFTAMECQYSDYEFGGQPVNGIALCSKVAPKEPDGSYHRIFTATNSILTLSSSLAKKLQKRLETLHQKGECNLEMHNQIAELLQTGEPQDAEKALVAMETLPREDNHVVLVVRGIPGCGKSYLIENSTESANRTGMAVLSNTQLFQRAGNTRAEQTELNISETYSRIRYLESLASGVPFIVIDDVHSQCWEYELFQRLARGFGYTCHVLEISCMDPAAIKLCHKHCKTGISLEQLTLMVETWEADPEAVLTAPWFNKPKHQQGQHMTLKQLIE